MSAMSDIQEPNLNRYGAKSDYDRCGRCGNIYKTHKNTSDDLRIRLCPSLSKSEFILSTQDVDL